MSREVFTLICAAVAALALAGMWWGWRRRARRDAGVLGAAAAPVGEVLGRFTEVQYVSTTPAGEPLVRVAAPGLRYRGPAELTVRSDGVTVEVAGERAVHLGAAQIDGSGCAGRRAGKAVEADGLALLRWHTASADVTRELESSFRFRAEDDQRRFAATIDSLVHTQLAQSQEGTR